MIFRFAHPVAFSILLMPPLIYVLFRLLRWRTPPPLLLYSDIRLTRTLPVSWRVRWRRLPDVLRALAWLLLIVALARPQSGNAQEIIRGQGIDIVISLDISTSMAALDFDPQNRLEAAKSVIADFIAGRDFDRIGLVVFARDAFHQSPPTLDYDLLIKSLADVPLASGLGPAAEFDGTAIGLGLASAGNMLRTSTAPSKVVILLTDGANNAGSIDPITAAQALSTLGIRVYTIGMGRTGLVPMPDAQGNVAMVPSDVDEAALTEIVNIANGQFFRALDLQNLQQVYDQIDVLEQSEVERQVYVRWQEQAWLLLVGGLILFIGERALRHTTFQTLP
jgi:Ca-activated chloride channel family protein